MSPMQLKCFVVENNSKVIEGQLSITAARSFVKQRGGSRLMIYQGDKMPGDTWTAGDAIAYQTLSP